MNIISIFSGRQHNISILRKYLQKALELNIIDEVHFWNNTRNLTDENYLKTISNLKRTSSTGSGNYIPITPVIVNDSFELDINAPNDIHIKIVNENENENENDIVYEIVLGGWKNTKSVIRENNKEIFSLHKTGIADKNSYNNFKLFLENDILNISKNNEICISQKIQKNFKIKNIFFKTGHNSVGKLKYTTTQNKGFYFMDTCEKSWKNYYNYYNCENFEKDIIIKCDDDIVFIDLNKLPNFIEFIKNSNYDLVFANTINNGVSAYFQQNKYNLIPDKLINLEYPNNGFGGSLWASGKKAEILHNYFIENYKEFLEYEYNNEIIPINTRFSINFFGYKGKEWYKLKDVYPDDEYMLTVAYVKNRGFKNVLYSDFYVSHLSFYKQVETGINTNDLIDKYNKLFLSIQ